MLFNFVCFWRYFVFAKFFAEIIQKYLKLSSNVGAMAAARWGQVYFCQAVLVEPRTERHSYQQEPIMLYLGVDCVTEQITFPVLNLTTRKNFHLQYTLVWYYNSPGSAWIRDTKPTDCFMIWIWFPDFLKVSSCILYGLEDFVVCIRLTWQRKRAEFLGPRNWPCSPQLTGHTSHHLLNRAGL